MAGRRARFTVSELQAPGPSSPATSSLSLFPGTLPTLGFVQVPFVFVGLAFSSPLVCTGEPCHEPAGGSARRRDLPCGFAPCMSWGGSLCPAPLNAAIATPSNPGNHSLPRQLLQQLLVLGPWSPAALVSATGYKQFCRGALEVFSLVFWGLNCFCPPCSCVSIWTGAEIPERTYFCHCVK